MEWGEVGNFGEEDSKVADFAGGWGNEGHAPLTHAEREREETRALARERRSRGVGERSGTRSTGPPEDLRRSTAFALCFLASMNTQSTQKDGWPCLRAFAGS